MRHLPKHFVEYGALRAVGALVNVLPFRAGLLLGCALAKMGTVLFHGRAREAHRRIRNVFGDQLTPREVRRVAWQSWRNVTFDAVELLRIRRMTPAWLRTATNCDTALVPLLEHMRTGRGAIMALPHMGNWETAGMVCRLANIPVFTIATRQRNQLVNDYVNRLRSEPGMEVLARGSGTMRAVIRRLRAGGFLAILPDVRVPDPGVVVPFLGGQANLGPGMALFARHANVPVFPCYLTRVGWSRQIIHVSEPVWPDPNLDREADAQRITSEVMRRIEGWIRADPGQWFWYNRRWLLDPLRTETSTATGS